jgi:hypothetical protein
METKNRGEEAAPDSWETADLEESVNRLLISSRKSSPTSRDSDSPPPPSPPPTAAATYPPVRSAEEKIAQVDQFLREALEKPRERISGELCCRLLFLFRAQLCIIQYELALKSSVYTSE